MRFSKKPTDSLTSSHFYWIIYGQTLLWNLNFTKKISEIVLQHTTATTQRATWLLYLCKWAKKSWEFKKPKYIKNYFFLFTFSSVTCNFKSLSCFIFEVSNLHVMFKWFEDHPKHNIWNFSFKLKLDLFGKKRDIILTYEDIWSTWYFY